MRRRRRRRRSQGTRREKKKKKSNRGKRWLLCDATGKKSEKDHGPRRKDRGRIEEEKIAAAIGGGTGVYESRGYF